MPRTLFSTRFGLLLIGSFAGRFPGPWPGRSSRLRAGLSDTGAATRRGIPVAA